MSPRNKRRLGRLLIGTGILLTAAGIALGWYNLRENRRAGDEVERVLERMAAYRREAAPEGEKTFETVAAGEAVPEYLLNPLMDMPSVKIDGHRYIGTLTIPALELELPILEDWSYPLLKIAPCRYMGSAYRGNMILCAHNYASHFGRLKNLLAGDEVRFTDMDGNVFSYAVAQVETLSPTAIEEMESGDWDLTLFTCTLGGQTRVTVRCEEAESG